MDALRNAVTLLREHLGPAYPRPRKLGQLFFNANGLMAFSAVRPQPEKNAFHVEVRVNFPPGAEFQAKHDALKEALSALDAFTLTAGNPKDRERTALRLIFSRTIPAGEVRKRVHVSPRATTGDVAASLNLKIAKWLSPPLVQAAAAQPHEKLAAREKELRERFAPRPPRNRE